MAESFRIDPNSAAKSGGPSASGVASRGRQLRRLLPRLRRRLPASLTALALVSNGDPPPVAPETAPHMTSTAGNDCLSLERGSQGEAITFSSSGGSDGHCMTTMLPLMQQTVVGLGRLSSDLEFSNLDFTEMTAQEVKLKFGLSRDLPAGLHANLDGSFGRVLGSFTPVLDQQLHATLIRPLSGHWETGLEARLATLGGLALAPASEQHTETLFLRGHYSLLSYRGEEQRVELNLSADSCSTTAPNTGQHARADLRYVLHRDANELSIGADATGTAPGAGPANPSSLRLDLRATRRF